MAITPVAVTFSLHDFLGFVPDIRRTKVILTTNVDSGWIADTTTGGGFRITDARVTIDSSGLVSFSVLPSGATGLNPTAYQIRVQIDAANPATRDREKVDLGWYTITAAADLKDLVSAQYVPPTYLTQVTADLDAIRDDAHGYADAAAASAAAAAALIVTDLGTTDGQTKVLIENPSLTQTALFAAVAPVVHGSTAGTTRPTRTGPVSWIGSVSPTNAINGDDWTNTATGENSIRVNGVFVLTHRFDQHPSRERNVEATRNVEPYFQWMLADWKILRSINVANDTEFAAALAAALPGDEIVVTGDLTADSGDFNVIATAENPIIIRAQRPHSVKFTGQMVLRKARYCYFVGFDMGTTGSVIMTGFDGGTYCTNNRIVGCRFAKTTDPMVSLQYGASFNQVLFCEFDGSNVATASTPIHGIILSLANDPKCVRTFGNRFAYNWFHDFPMPEVNDSCTIWLGQSTHSTAWDVGTIVEFNLIERCVRDDEIISIKSSGNMIRYNEFRDMTRTGDGCWLTVRHGVANQVYNNLLINCAGIRVFGDDHIISGNTLVGGNIEIQAGTVTQDTLDETWPACRRVQGIGNDLGGGELRIGSGLPSMTIPATNTNLFGNTNYTLILGLQTGTDSTTNRPGWVNAPLTSRVR